MDFDTRNDDSLGNTNKQWLLPLVCLCGAKWFSQPSTVCPTLKRIRSIRLSERKALSGARSLGKKAKTAREKVVLLQVANNMCPFWKIDGPGR